jgi:CDP-glucose 4,6-dehydratase
VRPYVHVLDALLAYLMIARRQYENPLLADAYNIGPDEDDCLTNRMIAEHFCRSWGQGANWEHIPADNPHESAVLKLDCSKIKRILGWNIQRNTKRAIEEAAAWYKEYFLGNDPTAVMIKQIDYINEVCF